MKQTDILGLIIISSLLLFIFLILVLFMNQKWLEKKNQYTIFITDKTDKPKFYIVLYQFLSQLGLTKRYINRLRIQYEILLPGDNKKIIKSTMKVIGINGLLFFVTILLLFILRPAFYFGLLMAVMVYVVNMEIAYVFIEKKELEILRQLSTYLGEVRHHYYDSRMVEEAIYDSLLKTKNEMELHGSQIYNILISPDMEEELEKYNKTVPNRFLRTFLAICVMALQHGDKTVNGQSVFLTNIKDLKRELNIEILKREKLNYLMSGLAVVTILPLFTIPAIKNWAVGNFNELFVYYDGAFGIISISVIFIVTMGIYTVIKHAKEYQLLNSDHIVLKQVLKIKPVDLIVDTHIKHNYGKTLRLKLLLKCSGDQITVKEFYIKSVLYLIATFGICILLAIGIHVKNQQMAIYYVDGFEKISSLAKEKEVEYLKSSVTKYVLKYKHTDVSVLEIEDEMVADQMIKNKAILTLTAEEIYNRIQTYQNEHLKWYEILMSMFLSLIGFYLPYIRLKMSRSIAEMHMDDEVIQFQSVILMLIHMDHVTVEIILEWMSNFSDIFKNSLQECLNNFSAGDMAALEHLKKTETFQPFIRIIENLQSCDFIGVEKAFNEIDTDRINYQEKRQQDNEKYINDTVTTMSLLAMVPILLVSLLYLTAPILIECVIQVNNMVNQITSL